MRVGLVIYGSLETISGGYLYDRKLVEHLRRSGDEVSIISLAWRHYPRHLIDNFSSPLLRRLGQLPVDILLQDELNHPSLFLLNRRLRSRVNYPIVAIVHHLRSNEPRPAWQAKTCRSVECRYLRTVDGFVFNSQTTRASVEGLIGKELLSVVACPPTDRLCPEISEEEIAARANQPGPLRIVFLGNVIPRKGLHTLLCTLDRLPQDLWSLAVIGSLDMDKRYAQAVRREVARRGLTERVTFLGPVSDATLAIRLRESHVLAVPSCYEGFGIVYLEGMGFGLPAIASSAGAASEIITPGKNGLLVPPEDSVALARHLYELSQDRGLLVTMSLHARRRYASQPAWDMTAERVRMFLKTVAGLSE